MDSINIEFLSNCSALPEAASIDALAIINVGYHSCHDGPSPPAFEYKYITFKKLSQQEFDESLSRVPARFNIDLSQPHVKQVLLE